MRNREYVFEFIEMIGYYEINCVIVLFGIRIKIGMIYKCFDLCKLIFNLCFFCLIFGVEYFIVFLEINKFFIISIMFSKIIRDIMVFFLFF